MKTEYKTKHEKNQRKFNIVMFFMVIFFTLSSNAKACAQWKLRARKKINLKEKL